MKNRLFYKIKEFVKDRYYVPHNIKINMIKKNRQHLKIIMPVVFIFSIFLFSFTLAQKRHLDIFPLQCTYYILMMSLSSFSYFFCCYFDKHPYTNISIQNLPLYISMTVLMGICSYVCYISKGYISSLLIFIIISIILLTFFYINPAIYISAISIVTIIMTPVIHSTHGFVVAFDFVLVSIILILLSLFRWSSLKKELIHTQIIEEQKNNLDKEISIAAHIQKNFYFQKTEDFENWDFAFYNKAMAGVSGDLYDFYQTGNNLDGLSIFDISGHGISSGLLTMLVKNILFTQFKNNKDTELTELLYKINDKVLSAKGNVDNYLTGILMRINNNNLDFVIAGHPAPIIYKSNSRSIRYFESADPKKTGVIGMRGFSPIFTMDSISLQQNDEIVLYTDGILEAKNNDGEEFGKDRFLHCMERITDLSPEDQIDYIVKELSSFRQQAPQNDDITIIILKRR